jgi:hypothetical protein
MFVICWSPKGGSGTSVVTAALSLILAGRQDRPVLAVDLAGDLPSVFGVPEPDRPGVAEWLSAPGDVGADRLSRLTIEVVDKVHLLPLGAGRAIAPVERWAELTTFLTSIDRDVVVDAGSLPPADMARSADHSLLVIRACYLALRRAAQAPAQPTGVVIVKEPGRALSSIDVVRALGVDVVAEIPLDASIARAVDAGLLSSRLPNSLRRSLGDVARAA